MPVRHSPSYMKGVKEYGERLKPEKERKFRDKRGRYTPYIELFASLGEALPIEEIIVGPHRDKEARASALRVLLGDTDVKVNVSDIPYID